MNTKILFAPAAEVETELLAVFAVDASANKGAKPEIRLLSADDAPTQAAQAVLDGGEFKAESCETLLLHKPAGLKAKRLLIIGLGKAARPIAERAALPPSPNGSGITCSAWRRAHNGRRTFRMWTCFCRR